MPGLYVQADQDEARAAEEQAGSDVGIPVYGFSQAITYKTGKLEWQGDYR